MTFGKSLLINLSLSFFASPIFAMESKETPIKNGIKQLNVCMQTDFASCGYHALKNGVLISRYLLVSNRRRDKDTE